MKDALLYIAEGAKRDGRGLLRDAKRLEASMAGIGTKDERLVWRYAELKHSMQTHI